jgi:hypothetical protein
MRLVISPRSAWTGRRRLANEFGVLVANCPTQENIIGVAEATVAFMVAPQPNPKLRNAACEGKFRPRHTSYLLRGRTTV